MTLLVDTLGDCYANPLISRHDIRSTGRANRGHWIRRSLPDVTANQWDDWGLFGSRKGERLYDDIDRAVEAALATYEPRAALECLADVVSRCELPTPEDEEADTFPPVPLADDELLRRRCAQLWEWQADFCKTNPEYVHAIERSHHV